jgi:hypothetical protein
MLGALRSVLRSIVGLVVAVVTFPLRLLRRLL